MQTRTEDVAIENPFATAPEALQTLINETTLAAVTKAYQPPMTLLAAIKDGLYEQDRFSFKRTAIAGSALIVGTTAAIFSLSPAGKAALILSDLIKRNFNADMGDVTWMSTISKVSGFGIGTLLNTYGSLRMLDNYLGNTSAAERYLKFQEASRNEKAQNIGRSIFDLLCSIGSVIPLFLLTTDAGYFAATATALANLPLSWMGVHNLPLKPKHMHPARRIELAYLNEQMNAFLHLTLPQQIAIIDEIATINATENEMNIRSKKVLSRLLNLSHPVNAQQQVIQVTAATASSSCQRATPIGFGILSTIGQTAFAESGSVGIARLFANSTSPEAISAGIATAVLSLISYVGFGFIGGQDAGTALVSDDVALAALYHPRLRTGLTTLLGIITALAGGTTFTLTNEMIKDFADAVKLIQPIQDILAIITASVAVVGNAIAVGYYVHTLLDDILIYFALRCGNENIKKLFNFVLETRRLYGVIADMSEDNFLQTLHWQIRPDANYTALSDQLRAIYKDRLDEYDLAKIGLRPDDHFPHYQRINRLNVDENTPLIDMPRGLRRRNCCTLFSSHREQSTDRDTNEVLENPGYTV